MQSLARALYMQEQLEEETFSLYKKSLHILEKTDGKQSATIVPTLLAIGELYENEGDYKQAIKHYERATAVAASSMGNSSLTYADSEHRLARAIFKSATSHETLKENRIRKPEFSNADEIVGLQPSASQEIGSSKIGSQTIAAQTMGPQRSGPQRSGPQTSRPQTSASQTSGPRTIASRTSASRTSASQTSGPTRQAEELYFNSLIVTLQQSRLDSDEPLERLLADYIDLMRKKATEGKSLTSALQAELLKDRLNTGERNRAIAASKFSREVSSRLAIQNRNQNQRQPDQTFPNSLNTGATGSVSPINPSRAMSDFAALEEINKQRVTFYERMIATDINSLGAEHPSVARDLSGLAAVYLSQRKFDEAKPLLLKALAIYEKSYPTEAAVVKRTRMLLDLIAEEQSRTGQVDAASNVPAVDYAASLPQVPAAAQKVEMALRLNYLAFLCYCRGQVDRAAKIYSYALAATAAASGQQSVLSATCMTDYSRVLASAGRKSESEAMEINAETILRRALSNRAAQMLP